MVGTSNLGSWNGHWSSVYLNFIQGISHFSPFLGHPNRHLLGTIGAPTRWPDSGMAIENGAFIDDLEMIYDLPIRNGDLATKMMIIDDLPTKKSVLYPLKMMIYRWFAYEKMWSTNLTWWFIDDLPIKNGDVPVRDLLNYDGNDGDTHFLEMKVEIDFWIFGIFSIKQPDLGINLGIVW